MMQIPALQQTAKHHRPLEVQGSLVPCYGRDLLLSS